MRWVRDCWRPIHRIALVPALQLLFPAGCFGCGRPLGATHLLGACLSCWTRLRPAAGPSCRGCGLELPAGTDLFGPAAGRCAWCLERPRPFAGAVAAVAYDGVARRFLLRAKLGGREELFAPLGRQLAAAIRSAGIERGRTIVPVPGHPWRCWRRGFDPARELSRVVARCLDRPVARWLSRRWRSVQAVKGLGAAERRGRLAGAFVARRIPSGSRLLLLDDVLTTGATAEACSETLLTAGADDVMVAAWARTPPRILD